MKLAQDQILLVNGHVIAQIVKSELVVRHICDVAVISFLPLLAGHTVEDDADRQPHKLIDLSHPLRVTFGQIIVDCDDVDASSLKSIEVGGHGRYERLTFTGPHLRNAALVQNDAADQLHAERLHTE